MKYSKETTESFAISLQDLYLTDKHSGQFENETIFADHVLANLSKIFSVFTGKTYKKIEREYRVNNARIDCLVEDEIGLYHVIEFKNPADNGMYGNLQGITQLLAYKILLETEEKPIGKLFLFTSKNDMTALKAITDYDLPIELVVVTEDKFIHLNYAKADKIQ